MLFFSQKKCKLFLLESKFHLFVLKNKCELAFLLDWDLQSRFLVDNFFALVAVAGVGLDLAPILASFLSLYPQFSTRFLEIWLDFSSLCVAFFSNLKDSAVSSSI